MPEQQKSTPWLQTMPGILTATAAIITAVTGLIAMLYQNNIFDKNPQKPTETIKTAETIKTSEAIEIAGKWAGQIRESSGQFFS